MTQIIDILYQEPTASDTLIRAHIQVDTAAELPAVNAYSGYTLLMGSVADDISTGDSYKMQSDGTWVRQPVAQSDTYTTTQIDTLIDGRIPFAETAEITSGADLDDYTTPGVYRCTPTSVSNYPPSTAQCRLEIVEIDRNNGYMQQRAYCVGATTRIFYRNMAGVSPVSWHPWTELRNYGNRGTAIAAGTDLDTLTTLGRYYTATTTIAQGTVHRPDYTAAGNTVYTLEVDYFNTASRYVQRLIACDVSTANFGTITEYIRMGTGAQWGSWYQQDSTPIADHT